MQKEVFFMSHITKLATEMNDIDCIKEALSECGYEYTEDSVAQAYGSQKIKGDIVVHQAGGAYDIAFIKQADETYNVEADWWGSSIKREDFVEQITQNYAVAKTLKEVKKDPRLTVLKKEKLSNGTERIRVGIM
jgi:hypothetical protein